MSDGRQTRRRISLWAIALSTALSAACSNSTAPKSDVLRIVGPDSSVAQGIVAADDTIDRVGCIALLRMVFTIAPDSATVDSATVSYFDQAKVLIGGESLSGDTLRTLGFPGTPHAGGYDVANIMFFSVAPWSALMKFYYTDIPTGRHGVAPYSLVCAPLGPLMAGRYALQSIGGTPLPFGSPATTTLFYDTLQFFPPNMSYVQIDKYEVGSEGPLVVRGGFNAYEITGPDTLSIPYVTKGGDPAVVFIHGDTLLAMADYGDAFPGPEYLFTLVPGSVQDAAATMDSRSRIPEIHPATFAQTGRHPFGRTTQLPPATAARHS